MKTFNKVLSVEVEIDMVAKQLRNMFKDDALYADTVVENIIGRSIAKDTTMIGRLMSAMVGVEKKFIVEVGNTYAINDLTAFAYWTEESITKRSTVSGSIDSGYVVEINPYADYPILIRFYVPTLDGGYKNETRWVSTSVFGPEPECLSLADNIDNV